MYSETIKLAAQSAAVKGEFAEKSPLRFFVSAVLAGIYIGLGVFLIYSLGAPLYFAQSPLTKLVMGASFSISLTLVFFAGAELFPGNVMFIVFGVWEKKINASTAVKALVLTLFGNLLGSIVFASAIYFSNLLEGDTGKFIAIFSSDKMQLPAVVLFFRAVLCNLLVCLALWMGLRTKSDMLKYVFIFLALFTFVASSFENSVANMSLLWMGILSGLPGPTIAGYFYNLAFTIAGNIVGGILIATGYITLSR